LAPGIDDDDIARIPDLQGFERILQIPNREFHGKRRPHELAGEDWFYGGVHDARTSLHIGKYARSPVTTSHRDLPGNDFVGWARHLSDFIKAHGITAPEVSSYGVTGLGGFPPSNTARAFSAATRRHSLSASSDTYATCGVMIQFSSLKRGLAAGVQSSSLAGSSSVSSSAAPAIRLVTSAS